METKGKESLAELIRQKIVGRIVSGHYAAGCKIPSVRALMEEFSVSSQTVQRALRLLQEARVVTAIHGSGVFVNEMPSQATMRLAMIFPEESISRENLDLECWGMSSELYRGLLAGGVQYDARLDFRHVSEEADADTWRALAAELHGYDAAIFVGQQLSDLQRLLSHCLPVFQVTNPLFATDGVTIVDYDRDLALRSLLRKAHEEGCRTAACITFQDETYSEQNRHFLQRAKRMLQLCAECGLRPAHQASFIVTPETSSQLPEMLLSNQADFLFCNHAYLVRDVFDLCRNNGNSALLGAIGSGFTFQGLQPGMIYMRVPMFEMGAGIVRCLRKLANGELMDKAATELQKFQAELVIPGETAPSLIRQAEVSFVS